MSTPLRERSSVEACAEPLTLRARKLAERLQRMLPQAAQVRVKLMDGRTAWPHLDVRATNATGDTVRISRTQGHVAARWIIRCHPSADWALARTFDLRTGSLDGSAA
ncbi:transcriptional regulator [Streptomyces sp. H27-H1]|uniref:transcriptional regulator n=1 Tax=Streptomyces sp. H27-H1 TaxID=2996461 RepID=UPI0022706400|nr:transcriptional regulator [Streptomyces sp. H27-H1]MCY0931505.1 transcriptional regulator [Streptomyces sp. H27-H1]